jgi:hypothetical protein
MYKVTQIIDRKTAIFDALKQAQTGDVVLIAGKGHESTQDFGTRTNHHILTQSRMSFFAFVQRCTTQSDAVIDGATIANFGSLANHNAHAMVKKYAFAQLGAWVNFNTSYPTRKVGNETSQPFEPSTPASMSPSVKHHCMQARVTREHLP